MFRTYRFFLVGLVTTALGTPALSGCGGEEFVTFDRNADLDSALDTQTPKSDGSASGGNGGSGGVGGSGGTGGAGARGGVGGGAGSAGASGSGGAGGVAGTDSGAADSRIDDGMGLGDAPKDVTSDANDGRIDDAPPRIDADSGRSGDVIDAQAGDTSTGIDANADAKDSSNADVANDGRTDASVGLDAVSTDVVCSEPTVYYRDGDGDGFGDGSNTVTSCTSPGNGWSAVGGDCRDDLASVKPYKAGWPDPPLYSGTGYPASSKPQNVSFDYDCSGTEDADPSNSYGPEPDCSGLLNCSGIGYVVVNPSRTGPGIDPRCGSLTLIRCNGNILNCNKLPPEATTIPYRCR